MCIHNIIIIYIVLSLCWACLYFKIYLYLYIPCGAQTIGFLLDGWDFTSITWFRCVFSRGKTLGYVGIIYIWLVVYDTYNIL